MREEREKKCQPPSSAECSSASAQSIADPLLEGASEVSLHPGGDREAAVLLPRLNASRRAQLRTAVRGRALGLRAGLPQGQQDPPAVRVKARFHPGEEIPRQRTERSARCPHWSKALGVCSIASLPAGKPVSGPTAF